MKKIFFLLLCFLSSFGASQEDPDFPSPELRIRGVYVHLLNIKSSITDEGDRKLLSTWNFPNELYPAKPNSTKCSSDIRGWNWMMKDVTHYDLVAYVSAPTSEWPEYESPYVIYLQGNKLTLVEGVNGLSNPVISSVHSLKFAGCRKTLQKLQRLFLLRISPRIY